MNKTLFFGMFAASMLFATSCSNDDLDLIQSENEVQVTFSVGAENGIGSRTVSDGKKADKLVWAVYNEAGTLLNVFKNGDTYVGQETHTGVSDMTTTKKEVTVNLAKGQKYNVLFWAQDEDCNAYNTSDLRNVEVSYTTDGNNNNEIRDAFFACKTIEVKGNATFEVDLKRPFAQINVGVTKADWAAAVASGIEVKQSQVVIKKAATHIDLLDGSVEGTTDVTYSMANIISDQDLEVDVNKDGNITDDEKFEYLSMSYILANDELTGADKTNLESLEFTFAPETGKGNNIIFKEGLSNVPVQRNWRTNIIGQILTGTIKFEVMIDNRFDDENIISVWGGDQTPVTATAEGVYEIKQATELAWVANQISTLSQKDCKTAFGGKTIKLLADIDLSGQTWTPIKAWHNESKPHITIDGNGHKIIGMEIKAGKNAGFIGSNAADWTIKNLTFVNPEVESTGSFVGVVFGYQYGNVILENVDVQGGSVISTANAGIRIGGLVGYSVVNDGATLSLTDCDVDGVTLRGFHNVGGLVGTVDTANKVTMTNCTSTNNTFKINNSSASNAVESWNAYDCNSYVPGLSTKVNCSESGNTLVYEPSSAASLGSALASGISNINLAENTNYGTVTVGELKDVTIDGAGSTLIFKTDANTKIKNVTLKNATFEYTGATADCGIVIDANAEIENLVIEKATFAGTGAKAGRGLSGYNNNASIVIKNCTFKDLGYPIYAWGGYESFTIEGCTFENIKSWAIMPQSGFDGDLTVTGCKFVNCIGGGLIKAGTLTAGHTFTFTNNTITGCTVTGDHNWFQFNVSAGDTVINGNTKDGSAWTPSTTDGLKQ